MAAPYENFADRLRQMLDRARFEEGRGRTGALADRCRLHLDRTMLEADQAAMLTP